MPDQPTRGRVDGKNARRIQTVEVRGAYLPQIVRRGIGGTEIDEIELRVVRKPVPGGTSTLVGSAAPRIPGAVGRLEFRVFVGLTRRRRHRVETPFQLSGLEVIGGHIAAHAAPAHIRSTVADDDEVASNLRSTGARIGHRMVGDRVDIPDLASGRRIQHVQPAVNSCDVDPPLPDGDAAVDQIATGIARRRRFSVRIVLPQLLAARRVQGVDVAPRTGRVHDAIDDDGRRFLAPLRRAQVVLPGEAKAPDVSSVDLLQRRVVGTVLISAAGEPVLCKLLGRIESGLIHIAGRGLHSGTGRVTTAGGHHHRSHAERDNGRPPALTPDELI